MTKKKIVHCDVDDGNKTLCGLDNNWVRPILELTRLKYEVTCKNCLRVIKRKENQ